jgi:hypothetical protein
MNWQANIELETAVAEINSFAPPVLSVKARALYKFVCTRQLAKQVMHTVDVQQKQK